MENRLGALLRKHQLVIFFALAFALFWMWLPLARFSSTLPLIFGTLAPTLAAVIVIELSSGHAVTKAWLRRVLTWRVGLRWYAAAYGIPLACGLLTIAIALALGSPFQPQWVALAYTPVFFVLALGEEIGWRGFALPRLVIHMPALGAAVILGIVHACFHLPLWLLPGMTMPLYTFASFIASSLCFGVLWTWLYLHTHGSVLIAAFFHGSINLVGNLFYVGIIPAHLNWLMPAGYTVAALIVILANGPSLSRSSPIARVSADAYG